jgi:quercetin dioxygenase-like cupin family protein
MTRTLCPTMAYFEQSGEPSDAAGRWASQSELPALALVPGLTFQPITTDSVMTNFVTFDPDAVADVHHHAEQQIAIVTGGELTFTVGGETRVMHAGDCVVIPPHVPHGGHAGPDGCTAIDVFTPPRAGIVRAMAS